MRTHVVAIQDLDPLASSVQVMSQGMGNGGLAGRRKTGEPQRGASPSRMHRSSLHRMLPAYGVGGRSLGVHRLIPHSVLANPAQRPARGSPLDALVVHGSHPMEM